MTTSHVPAEIAVMPLIGHVLAYRRVHPILQCEALKPVVPEQTAGGAATREGAHVTVVRMTAPPVGDERSMSARALLVSATIRRLSAVQSACLRKNAGMSKRSTLGSSSATARAVLPPPVRQTAGVSKCW